MQSSVFRPYKLPPICWRKIGSRSLLVGKEASHKWLAIARRTGGRETQAVRGEQPAAPWLACFGSAAGALDARRIHDGACSMLSLVNGQARRAYALPIRMLGVLRPPAPLRTAGRSFGPQAGRLPFKRRRPRVLRKAKYRG